MGITTGLMTTVRLAESESGRAMSSERLRQIEEVLHALLERALEMRQAFLQSVCADDADLRR